MMKNYISCQIFFNSGVYKQNAFLTASIDAQASIFTNWKLTLLLSNYAQNYWHPFF